MGPSSHDFSIATLNYKEGLMDSGFSHSTQSIVGCEWRIFMDKSMEFSESLDMGWYGGTMCLATFCGHIPKNIGPIYGRDLHFRILKWPWKWGQGPP